MTVIFRQCCTLPKTGFPHFWDGPPPKKVTAPVEEILVSSLVPPAPAADNYCLMLKFTLISFSLIFCILTSQVQRTAGQPPAAPVTAAIPQSTTPHPMRPSDLYRLPTVSHPPPSPHGKWV